MIPQSAWLSTTVDLAEVEAIVRRALAEDIGSGDVTADSTLPPEAQLAGRFLAKQPGVVAGLEVARLAFALIR